MMNSLTTLSRGILRNRLPHRLTKVASMCIGPSKPNPKSLILIKDLPITVTNESFAQVISSIENVRKSEVEPGCALHLIDQVAAEYAAQQIRQLNLKVSLYYLRSLDLCLSLCLSLCLPRLRFDQLVCPLWC
jgi:hypothetical protein